MRRTAAAACLLLALVALAGCTGNTDRDSNLDGLPDRYCLRGWTVEVVTEEGPRAYTATCDPMLEDTNGDGLTDLMKFTFGLDPRLADTDGDGLTDCQEILHTVRQECEDPDFHGPTDGGYGTNSLHWDSDGDGLSDGMEVNGFLIKLPGGIERFVVTDPLSRDTVGNGLSDGQEVLVYGTDPTVWDTDGDGCRDGMDPYPLFRELYRLDLLDFTLHQARDEAGGANLHFDIRFLENHIEWPASGTIRVQEGETVDLSGLWEQDLRPARCAHWTTHQPWGFIQIAVFHVQGDDYHRLDTYSLSGNPRFGEVVTRDWVYWHARSDDLSWSAAGDDPFDGPATWSGVDGELRFIPSVANCDAGCQEWRDRVQALIGDP